MDDSLVIEIWELFKEYVDKKQIEIVAEKYIDLCADHGVCDQVFTDCLGTDHHLDDAIRYYLEVDEDNEDGKW